MLGSNFQPSVFGNAELVYEITKHLTATDKASAARVCHLWNNNVNWNARETVYRVCRAVSLGCIKTLRKALVNKTTRRSACILGLVSSALGMTIPFTAAIPVVPVPCDNGELGAELLSSVDEWDEDVLHFITALAASSGREGLLRVLLKVADPSGFSLTSESALDGLEILEGLIGICASGNVNARWKESKTYSRGVRLLAMQDSADLPQLPLVVAIRNNHLDIVKLLLQDERVSPTGEHIVEAVEYDKIDVVKALLEDGRADPAATHNGMLNAALVLAESPEIIRLFLDDPRIDPSVGSVFEFRLSDDEEGCYCVEPLEMILQDGRAQPVRETLKSAVKEGSSEAVLALLKDGRAVPDLRLLFDAVKSDDPIKVRGLLEDPRVIIGDCSEFEDLTLRATNGYHHCGVQIPRLLLIKRLMEEEEEMNRVDNETKPSHGDTLSRLLVDACAAGHEEVLQFLLRDGRADPSYRWPNRPLSLAITSQSWGCLEHLLEDGRAQPSPNDLQKAASANFLSGVKRLLSDGRVDPRSDDSNVLRAAASVGNQYIVEMLLKDGRADPGARQNEALRLAAAAGHLQTVKLLLADKRTDPAAKDSEALRAAAFNGHLEVVRALWKPDHPSGQLALFAAYAGGHDEVISCL